MASDGPGTLPPARGGARVARWTSYVLIGAVVGSSLLGINALVFSEQDDLERRILATALCVALACVFLIAGAEGWERPGGRAYASIGAAVSSLGLLGVLIYVWSDVNSLEFLRMVASLLILGTACAHGAHVLRVGFARRTSWLRTPTLACAALLACLLIIETWGGRGGRVMWRVIGVVLILTTAGTILISVLHRLGKTAHVETEDYRQPRVPTRDTSKEAPP